MQHIDTNQRRARAIVANETIYMGGQVGSNLDAGIEDQTRSALQKISDLLEATGSCRQKVTHVTIWLKSMDDYTAMNVIWDEWVDPEFPPTRACCAAPMADPRILVEFIPIAVT